MKVRVFALAKELGMDSKDFIVAAGNLNIPCRNSALYSFTVEEADRLKQHFQSLPSSAAEEQRSNNRVGAHSPSSTRVRLPCAKITLSEEEIEVIVGKLQDAIDHRGASNKLRDLARIIEGFLDLVIDRGNLVAGNSGSLRFEQLINIVFTAQERGQISMFKNVEREDLDRIRRNRNNETHLRFRIGKGSQNNSNNLEEDVSIAMIAVLDGLKQSTTEPVFMRVLSALLLG